MATYEARWYNLLLEDSDGNYFVAIDSLDGDEIEENAYFDDNSADQTFSPNETLTFRAADGTDGGTATYLGYTTHGIIIDFEGQRMVFTTRPLAADDDVPFTAADFAVCFYPGTLIATPDGDRAVETLVEGDLVLTADGTARPLKWVWHQSVTTVFADALRGLPIVVRAGALSDNLPVRDLIVSPDHALLHDGMLVHAGALVNGSSVVRMTGLPAQFTYYHLELEDHALVLAEGVAAETFVDAVTRRRFDNWREYEARIGRSPAIDPIDLPRVTSARQLPEAMRARHAARAARQMGKRAA